jgi:hypothetical protein
VKDYSVMADLLGIRRYAMSRETMRIMILLKSALGSFKGLFPVEEVPKPRSIASQSALSMSIRGICRQIHRF